MKLRDSIYNTTDEIHKALSSTGYTSKSMKKDSDILMMNKIQNDIGNTGICDKSSKRKKFLLIDLPKKVVEIENYR